MTNIIKRSFFHLHKPEQIQKTLLSFQINHFSLKTVVKLSLDKETLFLFIQRAVR